MKKKYLIYLILILTVVFISIFILNEYSFFTSDDFSFLYDYRGTHFTGNIRRITSFSQIIVSMKHLYLYVNGRIIPHLLLQMILTMPKIVFNILNSFCFIILGLLIYKLSNASKKILDNFKPIILIGIYCLMYILLPSFGMTILWCSGSLNYLWSTVFSLLYFIYLNKLCNQKEKCTFINYVFIFLLGLCASNGVENASVSVIFFTVMTIIISVIKNKKIKLWCLVALLSNISGLFLLLTGGKLSNRSIIDFTSIFQNLKQSISSIIESTGYLYIIILPLFIILPIIMNIDRKKQSDISNIYIYFLTALVSIFSMIVSPYIPPRAFFFSYVLIIICLVYLFNIYVKNNTFKTISAVVIFIFATYLYFEVCLKDVRLSYNEFNKIENIILNSKENKISNIEIPFYYKNYSKYSVFNNINAFITMNENDWINRWYAFYYDVESIKVKKIEN